MNERIKELAEQADNWSDEEFHRLFLANETPDRQKLFKTKFAELIIRECAEQCTTDGPFVAEVVWGKQFHKKILEHFGVE